MSLEKVLNYIVLQGQVKALVFVLFCSPILFHSLHNCLFPPVIEVHQLSRQILYELVLVDPIRSAAFSFFFRLFFPILLKGSTQRKMLARKDCVTVQ